MYSREINGQEFTFGVSGKLIRNVLVMYDRQTESYWSQLLGESVEGEMVGTKLDFVPSWFVTWEEWKEMHPETIALDKGARSSSRDVYEGYYSRSDAGVIGETIRDSRLSTKQFVVGVEVTADTAVAYPFEVLSSEAVVNDTVDGVPLLVTFNSSGTSGNVFNRMINGQTLTFSDNDDGTMSDAETGSTWDSATGEAIAGDLADSQLDRIKSTTTFWFGWTDWHPDTLVYGI